MFALIITLKVVANEIAAEATDADNQGVTDHTGHVACPAVDGWNATTLLSARRPAIQ